MDTNTNNEKKFNAKVAWGGFAVIVILTWLLYPAPKDVGGQSLVERLTTPPIGIRIDQYEAEKAKQAAAATPTEVELYGTKLHILKPGEVWAIHLTHDFQGVACFDSRYQIVGKILSRGVFCDIKVEDGPAIPLCRGDWAKQEVIFVPSGNVNRWRLSETEKAQEGEMIAFLKEKSQQ